MDNRPPAPPAVPQFTQERAYLLRSWQDKNGNWLFNLQTVGQNPERIGFQDLEALLQFLQSSYKGVSR